MSFFAFIITAVVLFTSCTTDEDPDINNPDNPASGPFVAKVDNVGFPEADLTFTTAKFISSTKMLQITGQPTDRKETITITLMPFAGKVSTVVDWKAGTYDFNPAQMTTSKYLASAEYNKWNGGGYDQWFTKWEYVKTGSIIIESNDGTRLKGAFSFDAVQKNSDGTFNSGSIKRITAGAFELTISSL